VAIANLVASRKSKSTLKERRPEMRTNYKFFAPLAVAVLAIIGLMGCGGSGSSTGPVTVTVTPANPSVAVGSMQTFTANVVGGTSPATVVWSVMGAGTIDASSGVYTAPAAVPATNDVVTATSQGATGSAIVNVTASQALQVMPSGPAVSAGMSQTFTATSGGNPVGSVTWQVNGVLGGDCVAPPSNPVAPCHGTIDGNGNFTAPLSRPPGGSVTITALSGTDSGTTSATILYSSASLTSNGSTGQYAIQYAGSDFTAGFPIDVAGSIQTTGSASSTSGTIVQGTEIDIDSGIVGVPVAATVTGGQFTVGAVDGRTTMIVTTNSSTFPSFTLQLALTSNQHGLLIDFDTFGTGSGTLDAQNANSFAGSLSGNYVFTASGLDVNGNAPLSVAGAFLANGGSIPVNSTSAPTNTQDVVDVTATTAVVTNDITLSGTYTSADMSGRGTITMSSTPLGTINFAYYMIDQTHVNIVEIDNPSTSPLLSGQIFSAPSNATALTGGVAFTVGGSAGGSSFNPYAAGGVFNVTGTTVGSGGLLDINNNGGVQSAIAISGGTYTNSTSSGNVPGRYTLSLTTSKGSTSPEFAAYTTTIGTALLVEIDTNTDGTTGTAFQQSSPAALTGSFATGLTGVKFSQNFSIEQDVSGQIVLSATSTAPSSGTLDLNSFANGPQTLLVNSANSTINAPTNNRGTAVIKTAANNGTFNIAYYLVSPTTAIFIDTDGSRVAAGEFLNQF
jgi:hypothetical protein